MVDSKQQWKAWVYLAPAIVLLLVFTVWPIFNTIRMAFLENYSGLKAAGGQVFEFGFGNFVKVIQYKRFLQCLKNTVLLCVATILSVLSARFIRFRTLLCGRPSIVVENGLVLEKELRKNRLTVDELMEELRIQGCPDFRSVKFAVLETNGMLSVLPYANQKPATAQQLLLESQEVGLPVVLISDGKVLERQMDQLRYDRAWLNRQLSKYGCSDPKQVFLLTMNEAGDLHLVKKESTANRRHLS